MNLDDAVTADSVRSAYDKLIAAVEGAHQAALSLALAERTLKEAEAQVWPGANETERKAVKLAATAGQREVQFMAEMSAREAENTLTICKLELDEQKMLLRLMELVHAGTG